MTVVYLILALLFAACIILTLELIRMRAREERHHAAHRANWNGHMFPREEDYDE